MTTEQSAAALNALVGWINSQDMTEADALSTLASGVGLVLGNSARDVRHLVEGVNIVNEQILEVSIQVFSAAQTDRERHQQDACP